MARIIKIDNAIIKHASSKKKKRIKPREITIYFLIVCEGEKTEPNYFKSFPKKFGKVIYDIKLEGGGISTMKVVETAIELRNKSSQKYDRVWAVFDKDSFKSDSFNNAILKANNNKIECAWSNEAFELWYLLHFHNRTTAMSRSQYKSAIENAFNAKTGNKSKKFVYKKNNSDMYSLLEKYGNQDFAINNAKKLNENYNGGKFADFNPSTQVYKLVEELIGKSEELKKNIQDKYGKGE